ncbi:unnamed protein product [marine sediment metagenome]|uniref:Uncharacterized protein n=1 Tax=marine sediment metagenome TaxID=412755 RepID=X1TFX3_9ZZZZ
MSIKEKLVDVVKAFTKAEKDSKLAVSETIKQVKESRQKQTDEQPHQG